MSYSRTLIVGLCAALLLAACGGSGSQNITGQGPPVRGTLLKNPPDKVTVLTAANLLLALNASPNQQLAALVATPVCDVAVYHIEYQTVGGASEATTASGALMVPLGLDAKCSGGRPILMYAHGTTTDRAYNIADVQNTQNVEGLFLAVFFATQGYIVVAPNYAGYDTSTLPYHPYLVADQQSKDMIDALTAARSALPVTDAPLTKDGGRLYITGYSQGGYVALATERALLNAGRTVTAAAPLSGPYSLAAFVDAVFEGEVNASGPESAALLVTAYDQTYHNIYSMPGDVFEPLYAGSIEGLLPSTTPLSDLYAQGKLPEHALFSATPPDAASASITPATQPANLATVFAAGFGANNLVTNAYRLSYLDDARMNPDGGWPTTTSSLPAANPGLALRQALKTNDLRGFVPTAPTLLCGGNSDPTVFWLNTQLFDGYIATNATGSVPVTVLDVDSAATTGDPYASLKNGFALARDLVAANAVAQGATDGGAAAVLAVYHAGLVPPFCLAAASSFFASH